MKKFDRYYRARERESRLGRNEFLIAVTKQLPGAAAVASILFLGAGGLDYESIPLIEQEHLVFMAFHQSQSECNRLLMHTDTAF